MRRSYRPQCPRPTRHFAERWEERVGLAVDEFSRLWKRTRYLGCIDQSPYGARAVVRLASPTFRQPVYFVGAYLLPGNWVVLVTLPRSRTRRQALSVWPRAWWDRCQRQPDYWAWWQDLDQG